MSEQSTDLTDFGVPGFKATVAGKKRHEKARSYAGRHGMDLELADSYMDVSKPVEQDNF